MADKLKCGDTPTTPEECDKLYGRLCKGKANEKTREAVYDQCWGMFKSILDTGNDNAFRMFGSPLAKRFDVRVKMDVASGKAPPKKKEEKKSPPKKPPATTKKTPPKKKKEKKDKPKPKDKPKAAEKEEKPQPKPGWRWTGRGCAIKYSEAEEKGDTHALVDITKTCFGLFSDRLGKPNEIHIKEFGTALEGHIRHEFARIGRPLPKGMRITAKTSKKKEEAEKKRAGTVKRAAAKKIAEEKKAAKPPTTKKQKKAIKEAREGPLGDLPANEGECNLLYKKAAPKGDEAEMVNVARVCVAMYEADKSKYKWKEFDKELRKIMFTKVWGPRGREKAAGRTPTEVAQAQDAVERKKAAKMHQRIEAVWKEPPPGHTPEKMTDPEFANAARLALQGHTEAVNFFRLAAAQGSDAARKVIGTIPPDIMKAALEATIPKVITIAGPSSTGPIKVSTCQEMKATATGLLQSNLDSLNATREHALHSIEVGNPIPKVKKVVETISIKMGALLALKEKFARLQCKR